jgi:hypothetical protein
MFNDNEVINEFRDAIELRAVRAAREAVKDAKDSGEKVDFHGFNWEANRHANKISDAIEEKCPTATIDDLDAVKLVFTVAFWKEIENLMKGVK